jgi:hypothetical protein
MTGMTGLAAGLYDAVALAEIFGPGAKIGIGDAADADILAPSGPNLTVAEAAQAARLGRNAYFLAFGNAGLPAAADIAPLLEILAETLGLGFIPACMAAPWSGLRVFQGHCFEHAALRGNLVQDFSRALGGPVGLVPHETVRAGAAAIRNACTRLKEQGRTLALLDAIDDADCAEVAAALAGMKLAGGGAWAAARPHAPGPAMAPPAGRLAILSGALNRTTVLQVGAARAALPIHHLDLAAPDPAASACRWATEQSADFIISSSVPPDQVTPGAPAARIFSDIASQLAAAGISRFLLAGDETAAAVLAALGVKTLTVGAAHRSLRWLHAGSVAFCIKPPNSRDKGLFLPELEPQIRLKDPAN